MMEKNSLMKKRYRSSVMASIHETAEWLHKAGVKDKHTMRKFGEVCLTPLRPITTKENQELREATRPEKRNYEEENIA
jgi:putative transcriptional regulator